MDLRKLLRAPQGALSTAVRSKVDKPPVWMTPHEWSDTGGMYAGHGQAWIYRQLPARVLRDPGAMEDALRALAAALPGRQAHILLHAWEHLQEPNPATPAPLAAFQRASLRFLVPTRAATLGVQLAAAPGKASLPGEAAAAVDGVLGEGVPDFSLFDTDRAAVDEVLGRIGATPLPRLAADYLESWYTLGVLTDTEAIERDDLIFIGPEARLEFATAGPLRGDLEDAQIPPANEQGATVLSVRGTLVPLGGGSATPPSGALMRASVIYGRRATTTLAPLPVTLRELKNVSPRPLPLRQLAALHETLPCSPKRLAPTHQRVGVAELRAFGFGDPKAPGADAGLLLGTGGATMSRPVHVDLTSGNGVAVVLGDTGAGKTFLAEVLSTQAHLGGSRTLYLSGDPDAGTGYCALTGASSWAPAHPGDLDPFRWAPARDAIALHRDAVTELSGALTAAEVAGVEVGFQRATHVDARDLQTVMRLTESPTGVAKVMRELRRNPTARILSADTPGPSAHLPGAVRIDLSPLSASPAVTALSAATLVTHALRTATGPTLVVLDSLSPSLGHPALERVLAEALRTPGFAVLVTSRDGLAPASALTSADHRFVLSTNNEAAVRFAAPECGPLLMRWMLDAVPSFQSDVISEPAAGIYLPPTGTVTSFQMGPWPDHATRALTRGRAVRYAA